MGEHAQERGCGAVCFDPEPVVPVAYDVDEAAVALRLSRSALYELIRSGQIRSVKSGRRRLVPVSSLTAYLDSLDGVG